MFASEEPEPPHSVRMSKRPKIRLQPRQRRRKVTIKWDQSPIDPHVTEYCLVLSNRKKYTSLCGARGDRYGPYGHGPGPVKGNTSKMSNNGDQEQGNLLISCVGSRTHHTIENLEHGKSYFLSIFAINKQNNLTFPYGSDVLPYNEKVKQSKLKDGKTENVNLRRLDGKAVFKFKAGKRTGETMAVSVMPCGGAVDVIVFKQGKPKQVMEERKKIFYGRFLVKSVRKGERFIIEVKSSNKEQLRRTTGVEILATTQKRLPLPELPSETDVREYKSLRNCDSVTIGWMPSPDPLADRYCILTRETQRSDEELRAPNQCALDMTLRKNDMFVHRKCFNKEQNDRNKVLTEKINRLKPNRKYIVQVIVEKVKGKPLSYDFLTVQTNSKCT
ncbi:neuron derived neurotrophic factor nord [Arctopsyche grandis]|uniref:neuron derived neurotrophic factor nord n=1 Tax=Arctopsyche grandis TaxID=121162 RepID=UPI00406D9DD2